MEGAVRDRIASVPHDRSAGCRSREPLLTASTPTQPRDGAANPRLGEDSRWCGASEPTGGIAPACEEKGSLPCVHASVVSPLLPNTAASHTSLPPARLADSDDPTAAPRAQAIPQPGATDQAAGRRGRPVHGGPGPQGGNRPPEHS